MPPDDNPLLLRLPPSALTRRVRQRSLRSFLAELSEKLVRGGEVACLITTDREMRSLNRQFRGKDSSTDVLSFPAAQGAGLVGEIAISAERAAAQAAEYGHSFDEELRILMLHGVLHLSGLDHESDSGEMRRKEIRWRKKLGLPSGLIERNGE